MAAETRIVAEINSPPFRRVRRVFDDVRRSFVRGLKNALTQIPRIGSLDCEGQGLAENPSSRCFRVLGISITERLPLRFNRRIANCIDRFASDREINNNRPARVYYTFHLRLPRDLRAREGKNEMKDKNGARK